MNRPNRPSHRSFRILRWLVAAALGLVLGAGIAAYFFVEKLAADLPPVASLREIQLSEPLRIYSADGLLMGEFGAERRISLRYADIPPRFVDAFLAAEDARFFEHPGVDWHGLARAAIRLALTGEKSQGGSTITMQLARNVFLSPERTFTRKFREILLAVRIDEELSKQEILELYLNKIFLGERAYGIGAAALVYFGKPVDQLSLGEIATIAGLPKAPSRDNPRANLQRATERRDYVLGRMAELGKITPEEYEAARNTPLVTRSYRAKLEVEADYVAEMVRAALYERYGEDTYLRGFSVTTTIDARRQQAANRALRNNLLDYDRRHGWRGPEARLGADALQVEAAVALSAYDEVGGLLPALVEGQTEQGLSLRMAESTVQLSAAGYAWAKLKPGDLQAGDVVRIQRLGEQWRLAQIPQAQSALVALDPDDGAIQALVGGFDFHAGKFNRVTQAQRQVGSGFKPFLYTAGMAHGLTPASVLLDAPVVFDDAKLESTWKPENYGGDIKGPMRLREALVQSRNLVSIRLLQQIGITAARNFIPRFGLPADRLPRDLTLALGSAVFTPLELARGYATLANGGFVIEPYFIREIRDNRGEVLFTAEPRRACPDCASQPAGVGLGADSDAGTRPAAVGPEVEPASIQATATQPDVDPRLVWLITDIMRDVVRRGTAAKVAQLGRHDLAGKTGTTNDETDAWLNGFQRHLVTIAWVGFDQPQPLGRGEVGGRAALPAWMDFMAVALKGVPEETLPRPPGLLQVRINPQTGHLAAAGDPDAFFETVPEESLPPADAPTVFGAEKDAELQDLF